jgi:hypothetical protein
LSRRSCSFAKTEIGWKPVLAGNVSTIGRTGWQLHPMSNEEKPGGTFAHSVPGKHID